MNRCFKLYFTLLVHHPYTFIWTSTRSTTSVYDNDVGNDGRDKSHTKCTATWMYTLSGAENNTAPRTKSSTQSGMILWHINSSRCGGAESTAPRTKTQYSMFQEQSPVLNQEWYCGTLIQVDVEGQRALLKTQSPILLGDWIIQWNIKQKWKQRTLLKSSGVSGWRHFH